MQSMPDLKLFVPDFEEEADAFPKVQKTKREKNEVMQSIKIFEGKKRSLTKRTSAEFVPVEISTPL